MSDSARKRTNVIGFFVMVGTSAVTMLWLFWHHPVKTAIVTGLVFAAFAVSARLAKMVDSDLADRKKQNHAQF